MKQKQVMFMELANGQANATMGTIPSICFSVRGVSLYFSVQVVRNSPFECLLGLPFMSLGSTKCQEFLDGSAHLLFTDPNTGAPITVLTYAKKSSSIATHPVLMRRIFNCRCLVFPKEMSITTLLAHYFHI